MYNFLLRNKTEIILAVLAIGLILVVRKIVNDSWHLRYSKERGQECFEEILTYKYAGYGVGTVRDKDHCPYDHDYLNYLIAKRGWKTSMAGTTIVVHFGKDRE